MKFPLVGWDWKNHPASYTIVEKGFSSQRVVVVVVSNS
jgi:hypothetical protein